MPRSMRSTRTSTKAGGGESMHGRQSGPSDTCCSSELIPMTTSSGWQSRAGSALARSRLLRSDCMCDLPSPPTWSPALRDGALCGIAEPSGIFQAHRARPEPQLTPARQVGTVLSDYQMGHRAQSENLLRRLQFRFETEVPRLGGV